MAIYDDYEDLEEALEEEEADDWDEDSIVIVVTFDSSNKKYNYFTDNEDLKKGDRLRIRQYGQKLTNVTVVGYNTSDRDASRNLDIVKKLNKKDQGFRTPNKFNKKETVTMKKSTKVIECTKDAMKEAKDAGIKFQKGSAVIIAVKTAIYESDIVPAKVKLLIESGSGISDLIIGICLQVVAETFTHSDVIQEAAEAANFSGAVSASSEFTMIQDLVESVVGKAIGAVNLKTADLKKDAPATAPAADASGEKASEKKK